MSSSCFVFFVVLAALPSLIWTHSLSADSEMHHMSRTLEDKPDSCPSCLEQGGVFCVQQGTNVTYRCVSDSSKCGPIDRHIHTLSLCPGALDASVFGTCAACTFRARKWCQSDKHNDAACFDIHQSCPLSTIEISDCPGITRDTGCVECSSSALTSWCQNPAHKVSSSGYCVKRETTVCAPSEITISKSHECPHTTSMWDIALFIFLGGFCLMVAALSFRFYQRQRAIETGADYSTFQGSDVLSYRVLSDPTPRHVPLPPVVRTPLRVPSLIPLDGEEDPTQGQASSLLKINSIQVSPSRSVDSDSVSDASDVMISMNAEDNAYSTRQYE
eukprot:GILJ01019375.1.p1 GENE.GILJ01019375.1~~GILJ01019375.1.p1  ORF type:complete len:330 (-),score=-0.64 GILJ01019375.1:150-1139(-)